MEKVARRRAIGVAAAAVLAGFTAPSGCTADAPDDVERVAQVRQAVTAPLDAAYCTIVVTGSGDVATEDDYLPHVITCENGGANLEALKAQAIAARSVAYYNMATSGSICDGQGCQVYSCGARPSATAYQAVAETSGMYLSYASMLTYGFYVAGDNTTNPPACVGMDGATEHWVTYNEGKSGGDVVQTELGFVGPPGFGQNRGCMGQWGARCLENENGYDYVDILRFYYGDDIEILTAPGPCVVPTNAAPLGTLESADCDSLTGFAHDPDAPTSAIEAHLYFGGPAGDPAAVGVPTLANLYSEALCDSLGSCEHAFELRSPLSLHDSEPHAVHAYAIDSAGGDNAELANAPLGFTCEPNVPAGIRRQLKDAASFEAWKFSPFLDVLTIDEDTLSGIDEGPALPAAPILAKADDGTPEVWLVDGEYRRHVTDPNVMATWSFAPASVEIWDSEELYALLEGANVRPRPVVVSAGTPAGAPAMYLIDDDPSDVNASGGAGAGGGAGGGTGGNAANDDDDGCSCRAAGAEGDSSRAFVLLAAIAAFAVRRRRST
jgi:MYXO-CTERM domain-containing protein